jgi:hypothetical protein
VNSTDQLENYIIQNQNKNLLQLTFNLVLKINQFLQQQIQTQTNQLQIPVEIVTLYTEVLMCTARIL